MPTVTLYNWNTGASNTVFDATAISTISQAPTAIGVGLSGLGGLSVASGLTANHFLAAHYVADARLT